MVPHTAGAEFNIVQGCIDGSTLTSKSSTSSLQEAHGYKTLHVSLLDISVEARPGFVCDSMLSSGSSTTSRSRAASRHLTSCVAQKASILASSGSFWMGTRALDEFVANADYGETLSAVLATSMEERMMAVESARASIRAHDDKKCGSLDLSRS